MRGEREFNPWKFATIGILVVLFSSLVTGIVVANYVGNERPKQVPAGSDAAAQDAAAEVPRAPEVPPLGPGQEARVPPTPAVHEPPPPPQAAAPAASVRHARKPTTADIEACNSYASTAPRDAGAKTLGDALIGGAVGAGLGAASGAIAGGGGGAGKGAGIGGLVGAAAGTLYGLNEVNQKNAHAAASYRACMKRRGYVD